MARGDGSRVPGRSDAPGDRPSRADGPRCASSTTARGPIHFHATHDSGLARQVPLEAFRRFQNDLRIRHGQAAIQREHDVAVHAERRRLMEEWVAAHGTTDQRERFAAGVLPKSEWLAAVADRTFARIGPAARSTTPMALAACRRFLRQLPAYASVVVTYADYRVDHAAADDGDSGAMGVDAVDSSAGSERQRASARA